MDVSHGGAGVDDLVDEEDLKLGKLRFDNTTQETDSLDGGDSSYEGGGCDATDSSGCKPVVGKLSATFPCSDDKGSSLGPSKEDDPDAASQLQLLFPEEPLLCSKSMPPVSAMKGGREKLGKVVKQLTVTWAPDVYDPVPTSLCHTVKGSSSSKKKSRDRDKVKKNRKKGHKGSSSSSSNSSRGSSSSKEKKQTQRKPSEKSYKPFGIGEDSYNDPSISLGYDSASPEYCGSSFLKKTATEFHYSVAKAL